MSIFATAETAEYWEGCRRRELLIQRCGDCGARQFYPRIVCVACSSRALHWVRASGRATVKSFTVVRAAAPFVVALVTLAEGPTMMANIVDCDVDAVRIGLPVSVLFADAGEGYFIPQFTP